MPTRLIRLLLADVDGTLVTSDKVLTDRAVRAVRELHDAGVLFAVTSGRPPRGMAMIIEPLGLTTELAAFNGGLIVNPDMTVVSQQVIPAEVVAPVVALMESFGLGVWIYRGADWYVRDVKGPHVDRESWTVQFAPTLVPGFEGLERGTAKIVGVGDDHEVVEAAAVAARAQFGDHVSAARSQPYYLDVTHPQANKGGVVKYWSAKLQIPPERIATMGDMPNDVLMFAHSGLSIAMGNASHEVQRAARRVTTSNEEEGFANAVEEFIL
ncbi:Cof-type HAD-IIB family hydrolase [Streptomyces sp. NPDC094038]|uniref:Cof-type HAD-IIB family hydrolase n=1 Tax=Streptomyces sp. NPDC094038 TaxID=3366055 RepID=UPI0037F7B1A7